MSKCCVSSSNAAPVSTASNCPECCETGKPVKTVTLKHMVKPEFLDAVGKPGFRLCARPNCDVVYFHPDGELIRKDDLRLRVGVKETEDPVPLCYCFGFTQAMIVAEIHETGNCTLPQRIAAEVKAGHCACEVRNPQGGCCLGNVSASVKGLSSSLVDPERRAIPRQGYKC